MVSDGPQSTRVIQLSGGSKAAGTQSQRTQVAVAAVAKMKVVAAAEAIIIRQQQQRSDHTYMLLSLTQAVSVGIRRSQRTM